MEILRRRTIGPPARVDRAMQWFSIGASNGSYTLRFLGVPLAVLAVLAALAAWRGRRRLARVAGAGAALICLAWAGLYLWRPRWISAAIADPGAPATIAEPSWTERAPGLETADATVELAGETVESIALVRLDPAHYELSVHWAGDQPLAIEDWQRTLAADVVINGSYFEPDDTPTTPLRSAGRALGPASYVSSHGALVIGPGFDIDILDLRGRDAVSALAPYRDAMVSYPLLVAPGGETRAAGHDDWLANRTFVGIDDRSRILIATTRGGFFSLRRLGETLRRSPLALRVALNLDGGPIASQLVSAGGWQRAIQGNAEITTTGDVLRLAYQSAQARRRQVVKLPIVLAAVRRAPAGATPR
jgi:hypothetical protein